MPAPGPASTAVNEVGLQKVASIIEQMRNFVDQVYLPDTLAIASFYKDWFKTGYGEGIGNFMTYGDFPAMGSQDPKTFLVPRGAILGRDLSHIQEVDLNAEEDIQEFVSHSWYDYSGGKDAGLHPYRGETKLNYSGPPPPVPASGYLGELFLAQVAALEGPRHGGGTAGARADAVCQRPSSPPRIWQIRRWPN